MNSSLLITILIALGFSSLAQGNIERKIIVQDNQYYYVKVHPQMQVGTLYVLDQNSQMDSGRALAMPAGRPYNEPVNPLSWDLSDTNVFAISFLEHPLNDRNQALKRFSVNELKDWKSGVQPEDMIMKSCEHDMYAYNDPYQGTIKRSKYLRNFFFDGVYWNNAYWMVVSNNDELWVWKHENGNWTSGQIIEHAVNGHFTLLVNEDKLKLVSYSGDIYNVSLDQIVLDKKIGSGVSLDKGVLIENRDTGGLSFIDNSAISAQKPLNKIISEFAITIF